MTEIAISIENVSKVYKRYHRPIDRLKELLFPGKSYAQEFWALKDINLTVPKGKTFGIIGRNGSGKSTLLQIIAGTLTPSSGKVEVNGRIGALLELGSGFNPEFTGRENVFLNGSILGLTREEMEAKFEAIADFAGIGDFMDQPVKTYSSGMVVRLAFAVSVNIEPDILIIDEALAVGDAAFQFKCIDRLERLGETGVTVLFVSHDINSVKNFCDYAFYLEYGQEKAFGFPEEVAELYFMDLRNEQIGQINQEAQLKPKQNLSGENKIAFGSDDGNVLNVNFVTTNANRAGFTFGDLIEIKIDLAFFNTIQYPAVSIIILDHKKIPLGGRYVKLSKSHEEDANYENRCSILFSFIANLNTGNYFVTIRLENRYSDINFLPIDKQPEVLFFEVFCPRDKEFLGIFDFNINSSLLDCNEKQNSLIIDSVD